MSDLIIPDQSHPLMPPKMRPAWAVKAVDHLLEIVEKKPMWEVIDFFVSTWKSRQDLVDGYDSEIKITRATRANEFGANKSGSMRYIGEIPTGIMDLLDMFYRDKIDQMGKKEFWKEFLRRYPRFRVAEKI